MELQFHPGPARKELFETRRVTCQNKFVKLVHLVGFVIKKKTIGSLEYYCCMLRYFNINS